MSGRVQRRVREFAPNAVYIHCYAHVLNLALVDSVKSIGEASEFFHLLEALYVFVSSSCSVYCNSFTLIKESWNYKSLVGHAAMLL